MQPRVRALAPAPAHDRCVVFETSQRSWHGVTPVRCPADWNGTAYSTVFEPRPDEHWRRHVAMPAESAARSLHRGAHAAKQIIKKLIRS